MDQPSRLSLRLRVLNILTYWNRAEWKSTVAVNFFRETVNFSFGFIFHVLFLLVSANVSGYNIIEFIQNL